MDEEGSLISKIPLADMLGKMKTLDEETLSLVRDFSVQYASTSA